MKRVQRKSFVAPLPPNTVLVARPSRWGNPYTLRDSASIEIAISKYESWLEWKLKTNPEFLEPLRGHDLACYCPLDKPCHADVLLRFLEKISKKVPGQGPKEEESE
jgi:hypothetical protein